jgi:ribulose-5-phosphate 4-epimerase/fuculose-1-phosphate aldolase
MPQIDFNKIKENIIKSRENNEANLRKQLAYLYRIFDYYDWGDLIVTHLSVRLPNEDSLLILPFGAAFDEITPDNLIKVDFEGNVVESRAGFAINKNGTTVHRAIYKNLPEINCILHTHSLYGTVLSNLDVNFMMLDQISMMFHNKIGYHDFEKLFIADNEQTSLIKDIEGKNSIILKNHGLITVGSSLVQAFWYHYYLENSCKSQVLAMSTGQKIQFPDVKTVAETAAKYELWCNKNDHIEVSDSELLFDAAKRKVGYIFG